MAATPTKVEETIWNLAIKQKNLHHSTKVLTSKQRNVLFVGNKGAGKSTLIQLFRSRGNHEQIKPTLALEYSYHAISRQLSSVGNEVCNLWELGGGTVFTSLLDTPLAPSKLPSLHIILMLDLSKPEEMWYILETMIAALDANITKSLKDPESVEHRIKETLESRLAETDFKDHPDRTFTKPFLVPLVILGSKYDIFQNFDPEKKKIICRSLRFAAQYFGASLQFYSAKDNGLVKKARELLFHHGFNDEAVKGISQDYNRPLLIPAWSDSMEALTGSSDSGSGRWAIDIWKHQFTTHFPQSVSEHSVLPDDPAKDAAFAEPQIDEVRGQKDQDLDRYRRELESRLRQWDLDDSARMN